MRKKNSFPTAIRYCTAISPTTLNMLTKNCFVSQSSDNNGARSIRAAREATRPISWVPHVRGTHTISPGFHVNMPRCTESNHCLVEYLPTRQTTSPAGRAICFAPAPALTRHDTTIHNTNALRPLLRPAQVCRSSSSSEGGHRTKTAAAAVISTVCFWAAGQGQALD